jgi:type II secretion system protein G
MKITSRNGSAAFTLIELMAVITIIVILASLVVGGMGFVSERQNKEKAKVQIALLSKALEEYKLDMGIYPQTENTATGLLQTEELYQVLFYEGYDYVKNNAPTDWKKTINGVDFPKSTKIYLADLDPTSTKQSWVKSAATVPTRIKKIVDPWGNEYGYRTATNARNTPNADTQNPDFDLWSSGKDGKTKAGIPTDKTNRDDIRNF